MTERIKTLWRTYNIETILLVLGLGLLVALIARRELCDPLPGGPMGKDNRVHVTPRRLRDCVRDPMGSLPK